MSRQRAQRAAARLAAVQALYQMDVAKKGINEILAEFEAHWIGQEVEGEQYKPAEIAFFRNILEGVLAEQTEVDVLVDRALQQGWPLQSRRSGPPRHPAGRRLRAPRSRKDVPARVVIVGIYGYRGCLLRGRGSRYGQCRARQSWRAGCVPRNCLGRRIDESETPEPPSARRSSIGTPVARRPLRAPWEDR